MSVSKASVLCITGAVVLVAAIALADYLNNPLVNCATLYLVPILWVTWCLGWWPGLAVAGLSISVWLVADAMTVPVAWPWHVMAWDALMRLGVYVTVIYVVSALKEARDREGELARTDALTEIANSRAFKEAAALELERARRHQRRFTLAYIDLDDFKAVNDRFGHDRGDALLREVAVAIKHNIRATDVVARLGGDEFVILLPETDTAPAGELIGRVRGRVLEVLHQDGISVSLSVGAVTFAGLPASVDEMIKRADDLMYQVKRGGKNGVAHAVFSASPEPSPGDQPFPAAPSGERSAGNSR